MLKDGNDLSIDSFSDVVEAISRVQKEMGISGTTAREAATTIEGSVDSMKAAWQNWLAGLGNSNADMGALSQQLAESIAAALKNILPRVGQIAKGVVKAIPALFSDLVTLLPKPFQNAINAIGSVFNGLGDMFKPVRNAIAPLIASFVALGAGGIAPLLSKIPLLGGVLGGLSGPLAALADPSASPWPPSARSSPPRRNCVTRSENRPPPCSPGSRPRSRAYSLRSTRW